MNQLPYGEMPELVEWAALEMRSVGNCTGGSNPSLSAGKLKRLQVVGFEGVFSFEILPQVYGLFNLVFDY